MQDRVHTTGEQWRSWGRVAELAGSSPPSRAGPVQFIDEFFICKGHMGFGEGVVQFQRLQSSCICFVVRFLWRHITSAEDEVCIGESGISAGKPGVLLNGALEIFH